MPLNFPTGIARSTLIAMVFACAVGNTRLANAQRVAGPEDRSIPCSRDSDCTSLGASAGEEPRCVKVACVSGFCVKSYLAGTNLGTDPSPNPLGCSISPLVCGSSGQAVIDPNPANQKPYNEGKSCVPSTSIHSECQKATCQNKVCQVSNVNGVPCRDASGDICKRGTCAGGSCGSSTVDNAKLGTMCNPTETVGCLQTTYKCTTKGCTPTKEVKPGAQCAPDGGPPYLAKTLPPTFVRFLRKPSPTYSCSKECLLEYCGNNIIDRPEEECDGNAVNPPVPTGATCKSDCTLTKAPQCAITAVRNVRGNRITPLDTCTVKVTSTGGPATSLTINDKVTAFNTNLQQPCPLASATTFSAVLTGPVSPPARCAATVEPSCVYSFHEGIVFNSQKDYVYEGTITNPPQCLLNKIQQCKDWIEAAMKTIPPEVTPNKRDQMCEFDGPLYQKCKTHTFTACMMYQNGYYLRGLPVGLPRPTAEVGSVKFLAQITNNLHYYYESNNSIAVYPRVFIDANCGYKGFVDESINSPRCGSVEYYGQSSPVSLIMEDGYDIEAHQAVVSFPVNLGHPNKLYTWKGSSKAPLLVYDPQHKGVVTSPTQLFGNWTFGGQRIASREIGSISTEWENGYAALASLDENGDEKISDHELKDLALWFDANQNAISENGEVQGLAQHNIKELYYNPDHRDERTRSISATKGFMRVVEGRELYGRSVDWYAAASQSMDTLVNHTLTNQNGSNTGVVKAPPKEEGSKEGALGQPAGVSGIWEWRATAPTTSSSSDVSGGLLIIGEGEDTSISVNSIRIGGMSEIATSEPLLMFSDVDMTGTATRTEQGDPEITFSSSPDLRGVSLRSKAKLTDNGARLVGYSEAVTTDQSGATKTIRYEWSASRR